MAITSRAGGSRPSGVRSDPRAICAVPQATHAVHALTKSARIFCVARFEAKLRAPAFKTYMSEECFAPAQLQGERLQREVGAGARGEGRPVEAVPRLQALELGGSRDD